MLLFVSLLVLGVAVALGLLLSCGPLPRSRQTDDDCYDGGCGVQFFGDDWGSDD